MTECTVTCHHCQHNRQPKVWRYLCLDCAHEKQTHHQEQTGHRTQLHIAEEITIDRITRAATQAHNLLKRRR